MTSNHLHDTDQLAIRDDILPEIHEMLGSDVAPILDAALADGKVVGARPWSVSYRPGRSAAVVYDVSADLESGGRWQGLMAAYAGADFPENVSAVVSDGTVRIGVWRFPYDPWLTGLARLIDPATQAQVLAQVGIEAPAAGYHTRTYRPGRRAVLELFVPGGRIFAKVVRPGEAEGIHQAHKRMEQVLPVPHSLGWSDDLGVILLEARPGITLRSALETGETPLPHPERLVDLLDALPRPRSDARMPGPAARVDFQVRLLERLVPDALGSLRRIATECERVQDHGDPVPVHGDFHSAQILVRGGAIVGLIDIDDAVLGTRADDLALFIAGLTVVASAASARPTITEYLGSVRSHFEQLTDPEDLRRRAAAALLGFAGGPFRIWRPDWHGRTRELIAMAEAMLS
jgi:hypothetical protein